MSVLVSIKVFGDTGVFKESLDQHADQYRKIAERAKERGAIHHQFAVGDGFILIDDEWDSADSFQSFFGESELRDFMRTAGADPDMAPEISFGDSIDSPDKF